jgi:hypothetical protein
MRTLSTEESPEGTEQRLSGARKLRSLARAFFIRLMH